MIVRSMIVVAGVSGMASAQSATASLTAEASSIAPGESTTVMLQIAYDLAGASGGVFGTGLFGYGFLASDDKPEVSLGMPMVDGGLASGAVAEVTGGVVRFGGGVGLMNPLMPNPASVGSFEVSASSNAAPGSQVTINLDGAVLLARGDEITSVATNPGTNQVQLPASSITINIVAGGCGPADLAEPFGVISQSDVTEFVDLFFANDARIAVLAAPTGVVSQADVGAFVNLFFAGCPGN